MGLSGIVSELVLGFWDAYRSNMMDGRARHVFRCTQTDVFEVKPSCHVVYTLYFILQQGRIRAVSCRQNKPTVQSCSFEKKKNN